MIDMIMMVGSFICIVSALFFYLDESICNNKTSGKVGNVLVIIAAICFFSEMYVMNKIENQPWNRPDPYVTHTIVALQDGNEVNGKINGSRYSISGYINEKFMYVYGYKSVGGGMKIQKASAKNTVVYFNDDITPNAKWYKEARRFWWLEEERYTCDIFIPTDSLQADITIDLQR